MQKKYIDPLVLEDLTDLVVESLKEIDTSQEEPVEEYAHKLRINFQKDPLVFRKRFSEGYEILLEVLQGPSTKL